MRTKIILGLAAVTAGTILASFTALLYVKNACDNAITKVFDNDPFKESGWGPD